MEAHELQGKLVFAAALGKEEPCDTQFERCLESVEYHAERALALEPGSIGGLTLKAALIEGSAGVERAAAYLQERCEALGMPEKCLALRVDYAFKTGIAEGTSAAEDLLAVACARSREHCAVTAETLAGHASRHGHGHLVAKYTWQASRQAPTMGRWIATAENALRVGSVQLSLTAVRKAKALRTDDEALQKRLIRVERAALVQSLR